MRRRDLLALIAGGAVIRPLAAQAQPTGGMRRLCVLMQWSSNDPEGQANAAALIQGLGSLGWKEGGNLRIDWRWTGGDPALYARYAAELVAFGPEVIVGHGSPTVAALRRQTSTIPIVFVQVIDPVGQGFVESLARPGGNITGFSLYDPPMAGKWAQMLVQITPPVAHMAVLFNPATAPYAGLILRNVENAAPSLGLAVQAAPVNDASEVEGIMVRLAREERGGLLVMLSAFASAHRDAIVALAARHGLPAVYGYRLFVTAGGLMSYGADPNDLIRRSAAYVDRILNGAKPADLPVQNPTKFQTVLNQKTAKALGVTFPSSLLARADEVIE
jgi:putative tryptophan/tyrosine transport system substrate-binding protein